MQTRLVATAPNFRELPWRKRNAIFRWISNLNLQVEERMHKTVDDHQMDSKSLPILCNFYFFCWRLRHTRPLRSAHEELLCLRLLSFALFWWMKCIPTPAIQKLSCISQVHKYMGIKTMLNLLRTRSLPELYKNWFFFFQVTKKTPNSFLVDFFFFFFIKQNSFQPLLIRSLPAFCNCLAFFFFFRSWNFSMKYIPAPVHQMLSCISQLSLYLFFSPNSFLAPI